jgi:DNA-binding response OmpR family regulator
MVLVIDDDRTVRHLVEEILTGEGYAVSTLDDLRSESIRATVIALEPDCILLDSAGRAEYGASWIEAAWLSARAHRVPVIMFSAHAQATREAELQESGRSRAAAFSAVLSKPFDLDELIAVVGLSIGKSRSRD